MDTLNHTSQFSGSDILSLAEILKWPIVVLIIALILRKPFIGFLNRIRKIGHGGTTFEADQQTSVDQQKSTEKRGESKLSGIDRALGLFRPETVESFEQAIFHETNYEKLTSEKEKITTLIGYATTLYIIKHYESIYYSIYGSQLMILQQLNTAFHEDEESLKRYYDSAVQHNPEFYVAYNYDDYLKFLYAFNLIIKEGEDVKITILGVDFLKYLTEVGKTLYKRF